VIKHRKYSKKKKGVSMKNLILALSLLHLSHIWCGGDVLVKKLKDLRANLQILSGKLGAVPEPLPRDPQGTPNVPPPPPPSPQPVKEKAPSFLRYKTVDLLNKNKQHFKDNLQNNITVKLGVAKDGPNKGTLVYWGPVLPKGLNPENLQLEKDSIIYPSNDLEPGAWQDVCIYDPKKRAQMEERNVYNDAVNKTIAAMAKEFTASERQIATYNKLISNPPKKLEEYGQFDKIPLTDLSELLAFTKEDDFKLIGTVALDSIKKIMSPLQNSLNVVAVTIGGQLNSVQTDISSITTANFRKQQLELRKQKLQEILTKIQNYVADTIDPILQYTAAPEETVNATFQTLYTKLMTKEEIPADSTEVEKKATKFAIQKQLDTQKEDFDSMDDLSDEEKAKIEKLIYTVEKSLSTDNFEDARLALENLIAAIKEIDQLKWQP
jgi:hypothetical protein